MKVKDLIDQLQSFNPEAPVYINDGDGYLILRVDEEDAAELDLKSPTGTVVIIAEAWC